MPKAKRSRAVPLTIVPALAALVSATACHRHVYDPCDESYYLESACYDAVAHHGYWYGGTWYPRVYPYAPFWYHNRYSHYISTGGIVHALAPSVYVPSARSSSRSSSFSSRTSVFRGGFGGIGSGHSFAGS